MTLDHDPRGKLARRTALAAAASMVLVGADVPRLRLLVGGAGGSSNDIEARTFAAFLQRHLPPSEIRVVNLPGRGGLAAYQTLMAAPADGLTLAWAATPSLPARSIDGACPELMTRITLIGAVQREPITLVAPIGGPDGIEAFRRAAAAGDPFGTPPAGSPSHLAALRLAELLGLALNLVVFPSPAAVRQAVLDGNVAAASMALGESIAALREGRMIGLGIAAEQPAVAYPHLVPLRDNGLPLVADILRGLGAPAGIAASRMEELTVALQAVAADPEFAAQAESDGFEADWIDAGQWTTRGARDLNELSRLWQRAPWLQQGHG